MAVPRKPELKQHSGYQGKQAKTGNSLGLRFERALFQGHPEFCGRVRAHVISPGRMLVVAEPAARSQRKTDLVIESFLSFLATDMANGPGQITPLDRGLTTRIDALTAHLSVDPHEDLGEDSLL